MKKILVMLFFVTNNCLADDTGSMYGTSDNPQINGMTYDVHKPYIEPNQGFRASARNSDNNSSAPVVQQQIKIAVKQPSSATKQANNFNDDSWASNPKVEKVLKQAASDGKLGYVLTQAQKANVPATVAITPIVESHYNKNAVSPKGASGAWQLMEGTASDYGLSSKDRFDFNRSTDVAVQLLHDLHEQFGNWPLTFAAYNCGAQCVINALKRNPDAKDIDELSLPNETKQYVHKIVQWTQLIAGLDKVNNTTTNIK